MTKLFENSLVDRFYTSIISHTLESLWLPESLTCIFGNIKFEFVSFLKILDLKFLQSWLYNILSRIVPFADCMGHWTADQKWRERERRKKKIKTYLVRCQSLTDGSMSFPKASRICNKSVVLSSYPFQLNVNVDLELSDFSQFLSTPHNTYISNKKKNQIINS